MTATGQLVLLPLLRSRAGSPSSAGFQTAGGLPPFGVGPLPHRRPLLVRGHQRLPSLCSRPPHLALLAHAVGRHADISVSLFRQLNFHGSPCLRLGGTPACSYGLDLTLRQALLESVRHRRQDPHCPRGHVKQHPADPRHDRELSGFLVKPRLQPSTCVSVLEPTGLSDTKPPRSSAPSSHTPRDRTHRPLRTGARTDRSANGRFIGLRVTRLSSWTLLSSFVASA